jgi:drug/metabolite transporter (DMT)-like permease
VTNLRGAAAGLGAAVLFGVSAPIAKLLVAHTGPLLLSGLIYLGAGLGLTAIRLAARSRREAALRRADLGLLGAVALAGGVAGPLLLLIGLQRVSAVMGSLLLNLEAVFTIALAVLLFREHLSPLAALAAALIVGGSTVLALGPGDLSAHAVGIVAVAGACLCWGLDNNLTQKLSLRDPITVVQYKTLAAGSFSLALALATGARLPGPGVIGAALLVGLGSYGLSIVLDVYALRLLGAAREAAFFATAPFVGALAAVPIVGERLGGAELAGGALMLVGVLVLLRERHSHAHAHDAVEHEHLHTHDEHHQHEHPPGVDATAPHTHRHRHAPLTHAHPHVSDSHHRHRH